MAGKITFSDIPLIRTIFKDQPKKIIILKDPLPEVIFTRPNKK